MYSTRIHALRNEYEEMLAFFGEQGQVSFAMYIDDTYKKSLLLSAASFFEAIITNAIHEFTTQVSRNRNELVAFVDNKAIKRQYHTFFSWDSSNSNQFWGLFGDEMKAKARRQIADRNLEDAERSFLIIGKERNNLVHRNYAEANVDYTFEEIYAHYTTACDFVELITQMLST